jgi:hypothetical protein
VTPLPLVDQIEAVAKAVSPFAYVAGGAARYLYCTNPNIPCPPPGDIDLWLIDGKIATRHYVTHQLAIAGYHYSGDQGQAEAYHPPVEGALQVTTIRPIANDYTMTYGFPTDVINHFGFTVEQFAYYQNQYFVGHHTLMDQRDWRLRFTDHISCPIAYQSRVLKYIGKGYTITIAEHAKLLEEYHHRPQSWKDRIQEALTLPTGHPGRRILYLD